MPSPTEICNIALAHLGDSRINSIDGSETREVLCKTYYDQARREIIETIPWTFARKRAVLTNLSETPPFDWQYQAALPADCIRVLTVRATSENDDEGTPLAPLGPDTGLVDLFEVSGGNILNNNENISILYVADLDNPGQYSPAFVAALARLLASYIATSIDGDVRSAQFNREVYEKVDLPKAQYLDQVQDQSNENHTLQPNMSRSVLIRSRRRGNTGTTGYITG